MDITRLRGLGIAVATPFMAASNPTESGACPVDMPAFRALIGRLVAAKTDFLVVLGSTGEAATITDDERDAIVRAAVEEARGVPVIVGTGHNSTAKAVELSARAARCGAAGVLVVTPYYNKPQSAGLEAHFRKVAEAVPGLPIIAYNVPGRTGLNMLPKDLARLWAIPGVVAVKESSGNLGQIGEIIRTLPEGKLLFAGDDSLALPAIALGAAGLISVIGNILPAQTKALVEAALAGKRDKARSLHAALLPMMDALFLESNPAPVKAALAIAGQCSPELRLPLVEASESTKARLTELLANYGINNRAAAR